MILFSICFLAMFFKLYAVDTSSYTTKYDGVNLDEILSSDRLLTGYVNCLLELGPCTPDGKELKSNLPDAIENDCKKCTKRQREGADQVMGYIIDHRPDDWAKLEAKYNSDGTYKQRYFEKKQSKSRTSKDTTSEEKSNEIRNKDNTDMKSLSKENH